MLANIDKQSNIRIEGRLLVNKLSGHAANTICFWGKKLECLILGQNHPMTEGSQMCFMRKVLSSKSKEQGKLEQVLIDGTHYFFDSKDCSTMFKRFLGCAVASLMKFWLRKIAFRILFGIK